MFNPIVHHFLPHGRYKGFGVKLQSAYIKLLMCKPHDYAVARAGCDLEAIRQRGFGYSPGMIQSDLGALWDPVEKIMLRIGDVQWPGLAVDHPGKVEQLAPVKHRNGLEAQADPQYRLDVAVLPENFEHGGLFTG